MNIAICDDNLEYIRVLENYFDDMKEYRFDYDVFFSGEELISAYENNNVAYDAIFLDMEMKKLNGIETANLIRKIDKYVSIVFVTNYTKYMKSSFECEPFRFLVKPVAFEEMKKVFNEILRKVSTEQTTFVFSENRNKIRLFCNDIIYFECQSHYVVIYEKKREYRICKSMTELYNQIDRTMFCRVHNSFIVNFNYIREIRESEILLHNTDKRIPISRTYKKMAMQDFLDFKERRYLI